MHINTGKPGRGTNYCEWAAPGNQVALTPGEDIQTVLSREGVGTLSSAAVAMRGVLRGRLGRWAVALLATAAAAMPL